MAPINHLQDYNSPSHPVSPIRLRSGTLSDCFEIARINSRVYAGTSLRRFIYPHQSQHPKCFIRNTQQKYLTNFLNPRNLVFIASIPGQQHGRLHEEEKIVGYAIFSRLGEDAGAKRQIASRQSIWLWILSWLLWLVVVFWNVVLGGNKSASPAAVKIFSEETKAQKDLYWDPARFPERRNRWHALGVTIEPAYQRQGIGKMLMREVIRRAEEEKVCIGLESTPLGEPMYTKVGFELLGRFVLVLVEEERNMGGVMLWRPKGWVDGKGLTVEEE
ncbi:hypothetical protein B7494_g3988 [Chlorociboria aeruginascens]|nr:hypothetical protein B7494_g3988 [Chlorociboria aeruginascens]